MLGHQGEGLARDQLEGLDGVAERVLGRPEEAQGRRRIGHREQRRGGVARARHEAQDGGGDDAQRALAADEELLPVVARIVLAQGPQAVDHGPVGEHHLEPEDEVAGHAVAQHVDAARIGGDDAAEHGRALRREADGEEPAFRLRRVLRHLEDAAGLRLQRQPEGVDPADRVHAREREHHLAPGGVRGCARPQGRYVPPAAPPRRRRRGRPPSRRRPRRCRPGAPPPRAGPGTGGANRPRRARGRAAAREQAAPAEAGLQPAEEVGMCARLAHRRTPRAAGRAGPENGSARHSGAGPPGQGGGLTITPDVQGAGLDRTRELASHTAHSGARVTVPTAPRGLRARRPIRPPRARDPRRRRSMAERLSFPKDKIRVLLLEGINDSAAELFAAAGYTNVVRVAKALDRRGAARGAAGHAHPRHPLAHPADRGGLRRRRAPDRGRLLLGRHQPGRSRGRAPARHPGLQRALLEHPQRGRTRHRRDRDAAAPDRAALGGRPMRARWDKSADRLAARCAARRSASSATAISARSSRTSPRRWACGWSTTTRPTSCATATPSPSTAWRPARPERRGHACTCRRRPRRTA